MSIHYPVRVGAGRVKRLSSSIYLCVCVCVSAKNTAVCCLTTRKSPRNNSPPLGLAIYILRKMPTTFIGEDVTCFHKAMNQKSTIGLLDRSDFGLLL